jgi:tetratricopeptide (TPR) repeat protein
MRMLLKAMGFWVWGLIAIALSASLLTLSYRLASQYRWHETSVISGASETRQPATVAEPKKAVPTAEAPPKVSAVIRVIGKEILAAQSAIQAKDWNEALRNLEQTETKSRLTTFDTKTIFDLKGYSYLKLGNLKAAQAAYEAELKTAAVTVEETVGVFRKLFILAELNHDNEKAIGYGEQLVDRGVASPQDLMVMSQSYYLQNDCKNSVLWGDKSIAASREAGEAPKELPYMIKLQCASDIKDTAAMEGALVDLIRLTHKSSYWNNLLRIERQDERDDANTLMIYRIMYDTNSMNADTDYIEMAQLLGDKALPGEAAMVLEKATTSGVVKDEHKERTNRLLNSLKTRADRDWKGLPQLDAEAAKNPAGQLDVILGEVCFGAGEYQGATTAMNRALQRKGQLKALDEAYVYLGRSAVALKDWEGAKAAFANLKKVPDISPRVLKLWSLYAETIRAE